MAQELTIGKVAKLAAVNVETIRYYQRRGLLAEPDKPYMGYRRYSVDIVKRIRFIKRAQALGFTLVVVNKFTCPSYHILRQQIHRIGVTRSEDLHHDRAALRRHWSHGAGIGLTDCIYLLPRARHRPRPAHREERPQYDTAAREIIEGLWRAGRPGCRTILSAMKLYKDLKGRPTSVALKERTIRRLKVVAKGAGDFISSGDADLYHL